MDILLLLFGCVLVVVCIGFELYFLYAILISKNCKYPPAFPSFGNMKKIALAEAEKFLSSSKHPLKVVDLGCGVGGLLLPLAKKFPQHQFVGYDWDFFVCQILKWRSRKLSNLQVVRDNFMHADLKKYDLLLCFLDTKAAEDLSLKVKQEIKDDALIVSSAFELKGLTPTDVFDAKSYGMPLKVYVYKNSNDL